MAEEAVSPAPSVLVIGATGNIGAATVKFLSSKGVATVAGTRNPASDKAAALGELPNVTVAKADFADVESMVEPASKATAVLLVTPGAVDRLGCIANAMLAIEKTGAKKHVVVVSLPTVTDESATMFYAQFTGIEKLVRSSGNPYTIMRLPMFAENQYANMGTIKEQGAIYGPMAPESKISLSTVADMAASMGAVLASPADHANMTYTLASTTVTFTQIAAAFSDALGKEVKYVQVPYEGARAAMIGLGFPEWQTVGVLELMKLADSGSAASTNGTAQTKYLLGREPTSFEAWAAENAPAFK
jgi:uncharacterized protein YbjT (DUF2867 family)